MCKTENNNNNNNKPLDSNSIKTLNTIKMKKMKKSLLTLLTAILIGSSFTSCVENTIPDEVVAIYDGQASLLAAQAALLEAEANAANAAAAVSSAQAAFEQARTAAQVIANSYNQANNEILLAAAQASLAAQIAQDAADLADQQAALAQRIADDAADAALAAEQLAALIAQNNVDNATAIATLEALIAQNAIDAANAQEALANTIAQNVLALATAQENLDNMTALNAVNLAQLEAALEAVLAQAVIDAEMAILNLEAAQAAHAIAMAALANDLALINDDLLDTYFAYYTTYAAMLNASQIAEIGAQMNVLTQIQANALDVESDEQAIAGFNNDLAIATGAKADLEERKTILEASIAAGTQIGDNTAKAASLQADIDAIDAQLIDLNIQILELTQGETAQGAAIAAMIADLGLAGLEQEFLTLKTALALKVANLATEVTLNETNVENIEAWTEAITNYDATTAALTAAIADVDTEIAFATSQSAAAVIVAADAAAATAAADAAAIAAANAVAAAVADLAALETDVTTAQADVNAAAQTWEDAKAALAASTTQAAVDAAVIVVASAQAAYDVARANFDDQSSAVTWGPGADGELGIQDPNSIVAVNTYKVVTSITASGVVPNVVYTATFSEATNLNITGGGAQMLDKDDIDENTVNGDYYEFGSDDVATDDLAEFQAATIALDQAKALLVLANAANVDLSVAVTTAQAAYEAAVNLYENAEAIVATQEGVIATAVSAAADAAAAATAAGVALAAADLDALSKANHIDNAGDDKTDALAALAAHIAKTVEDYASDIQNANVNILQRDILIADMVIAIAADEAAIVIVLAKLDNGKPADLIAAEATLEALTIEIDALEANGVILLATKTNKDAIITLIAAPSDVIQGAIDGIDADIAEQEALMATAAANILAFPGLTQTQRNAINSQELANLITVLSYIQSDIELYSSLSTKYKNLIDSLL